MTASSKKSSGSSGQRILVANGANLDLLGRREPAVYGHLTLEQINAQIAARAAGIAEMVGCEPPQLSFLQTNNEGELLNALSATAISGCLLNAGAWTHTSLALADRLVGLGLPFVEVHLSNLSAREPLRQQSMLAKHAVGVVHGFGADSYLAGLYGLLLHLGKR